MVRRYLWIWSVFAILAVGSACAADPAYRCVLDDGRTVPIVADATLQNVAAARIDRNANRVIVFNPVYMAPFQVETRWFWFAHECAHQQLDQVSTAYTAQTEGDADCYAIDQLLAHGQIDLAGVKKVVDDMSKMEGDAKHYLPGPQRADHIAGCALAYERRSNQPDG